MDRFTPGFAHVIRMDLVEPMNTCTSTEGAKEQMAQRLKEYGDTFIEWVGWHQAQVQLDDGSVGMRFIGTARVQA